jgi:hypothetical protein
MAGKAGLGPARQGQARRGRQGAACRGVVCHGKAGKRYGGAATRCPTTTTQAKQQEELFMAKAKAGQPTIEMVQKVQDRNVTLPKLQISTMQITLVGDSPLICHRWSEKARKQILDKHMHKAAEAKGAKDPEQDFKSSLYPMPDGKGYGFPAVAFKAAAVDAALFADAKKTTMRGSFHIDTDLVPIDGKPTSRVDMVRVGMGQPDVRFRGEFKQWKATLRIRYNSAAISAEQIANLFNTAGFAIGIGEWRPQKDGSFGMFHVA